MKCPYSNFLINRQGMQKVFGAAKCHFKYLMYADGKFSSSSILPIMGCGSVPLLVKSQWTNAWSRCLQPYKHYLPITDDPKALCSDMKAKVSITRVASGRGDVTDVAKGRAPPGKYPTGAPWQHRGRPLICMRSRFSAHHFQLCCALVSTDVHGSTGSPSFVFKGLKSICRGRIPSSQVRLRDTAIGALGLHGVPRRP